ncbi:hypothetical protein DSUL_60272 [Desulfovibrionales bacterium]
MAFAGKLIEEHVLAIVEELDLYFLSHMLSVFCLYESAF